MDIDALSKEFYAGHPPETISKLVRLEVMAVSSRYTLVEAKFGQIGVPFSPEAAWLYARLSERAQAKLQARYWYKRLSELVQKPWTMDLYRSYCLMVRAFGNVIESFDDPAEGAAYVLPAFRLYLKERRDFDELALRLAEELAPYDGRILKATARVVLKSAINTLDHEMIVACQRILGRPLTTSEARRWILCRLRRMESGLPGNDPFSATALARDIVQADLAQTCGRTLVKTMTNGEHCFSLREYRRVVSILGLSVREEDLLALWRASADDLGSLRQTLTIARAWGKMNPRRHKELVTRSLQILREYALKYGIVTEAQDYAKRLREPLTVEELREVLSYIESHHDQSNFVHYVPQRDCAEALLALALSQQIDPTPGQVVAADQSVATAP